MGDMFMAPIPRCPTHGQMNFTPPGAPFDDGRWVCHGWDGEGCDYQAPPPEWTRVGDVTGFRFMIDRPGPLA